MRTKILLGIIALTFNISNINAQKMIDTEIQKLTQGLIDNGTQFNLEYLNKVYDDNLKFVRVDKENNVEVFIKADNIAFFKSLKDSDSAPLNTYAVFHYADNDGENGFIILTRRMKQPELDAEQEFTFNIQWKKTNGEWKIIRETVYIR